MFKEKIDFPIEPSIAFLVGETGSERKVQPLLKDDEVDYMIALAWHQKFGSEYPLTKSEYVNLMRLGWIEVKDDAVYKKIIGIQNNSIKKKVNILVGETVKLPIAFIVGISFISGSFCGDILRLNLDNGKE